MQDKKPNETSRKVSLSIPKSIIGVGISSQDLIHLSKKDIVFEIGQTDSGVALRPVKINEDVYSIAKNKPKLVIGENEKVESFFSFGGRLAYNPVSDTLRIYRTKDAQEDKAPGKEVKSPDAVENDFSTQVGLVRDESPDEKPETGVVVSPQLSQDLSKATHLTKAPPGVVDPETFIESVDKITKNIQAVNRLVLAVGDLVKNAGVTIKSLFYTVAVGIFSMQVMNGQIPLQGFLNSIMPANPIHRSSPHVDPADIRAPKQEEDSIQEVSGNNKVLTPEEQSLGVYLEVEGEESSLDESAVEQNKPAQEMK